MEPAPVPLDVLVAEDVEEVRLAAVGLLETRAHRPSQARTGAEAIEILETARYDVILMDVMMPDVDGLEATRRLRKREHERDMRRTPVLAFTAGGPSAKPEACLEAGMDAFLRKPVNGPVLIETVERFGTGKAALEKPGEDGIPRSLLRVADGNEEHLKEMARVFLEFAPLHLRELRLAEASGDPAAMAETAGELRASARVFHADGILIPAERLEFLAGRGVTDVKPLVDHVAEEVEVLEAALKRVRDGR